MEHPTRGLDLESNEYYLGDFAEPGQGREPLILFISSELDELLDRSHRVLVFFGGRVRIP